MPRTLQAATALAARMVAAYGMSARVGPLSVGPELERFGIGLQAGTEDSVGSEIRRLVGRAHTAAAAVLTEHRRHLDLLATRLFEVETLEQDDVDALLAEVPRPCPPRPRLDRRRVVKPARPPASVGREAPVPSASYPVTDRAKELFGVAAASARGSRPAPSASLTGGPR